MPLATKVRKAHFIKDLTAAGLTYTQAESAYAAVMKTIENGVGRHQSVVLGRVGTLHVKDLKARRVVMGCHRDQTAGQREYLVGARKRYRFSLFKSIGTRFGLVP